MIENKVFSGIMDSDSPYEKVAPLHHVHAQNIIFKGDGGNLRAENVPGSRLITGATLPAGTNVTIGHYYDSVHNRVYYFNYNSNGNHGIYQLDKVTETIATVVVVGADTQGDVLGFDLNTPIIDIDLLHSTDGDLLYWLNCQGQPCKINIQTALAAGYGLLTRDMLTVLKAPPVLPPQVVYEHDNNVTANNLKGSLFQFACAHQYMDKERSVLSAYSAVPLPTQPFNQGVDNDVKKNSRIAVYIETGTTEVKKLFILMRRTTTGITSEWQRVIVLDKTTLGIPDNSVYRYVFYNDGQYPPIDPKWAALLQDYVPDKAEGQSLLNGTIPAYGGITEGQTPVTPDMTLVMDTHYIPNTTINGMLFFAYQSSPTTIEIHFTGAGTNNGSNEPISITNLVAIFNVKAASTGGTDQSFSYTLSTSSFTIASVLTALATAAAAKGFTTVSQTTNRLVLSSAPMRLYSSSMTGNSATGIPPIWDALYVPVPEASYSLGLQYYSRGGKTGGVVTQKAWNMTTPSMFNGSNTDIKFPSITLAIRHRPPPEAEYFHIVRTAQQTYGKQLHWVSRCAYSNVTQNTGTLYAYIGIDNINEYNAINHKDLAGSQSGNTVGYEFTPGDRIRFLARYNTDLTKSNLFGKDYEIIGITQNPNINGVIKTGSFVTIAYPVGDIGSGFDFSGAEQFQNYHILLYSTQPAAGGTEAVYYECSRMYRIGNAGTNTAFHYGDVAQSTDLVTAANITVGEGEQFFRTRTVPASTTYDIPAPQYTQLTTYSTYQTTLPSNITTSKYTIVSHGHFNAGLDNAHYPTFGDNAADFYNQDSANVTVNIKGDIQVSVDNPTVFSFLLKIVSPSNSIIINTIYASVSIEQGQALVLPVDTMVNVPAGYKLFGIFGNASNVNMTVAFNNLQYRLVRNIVIPIVEDTYSDTSGLRVANNGRPTVVQPDERPMTYGQVIRYGNAYQTDSQINDSNRFYPQNKVAVDKSKGDIRRLLVEQRRLYIYQQRGVGVMGVYSKILHDNNQQVIEVATDEILSRDNIDYLIGDYGVNDDPESIIRTNDAHFFIDKLRGYIIARYNNGLKNISEERYGNETIRNLILAYNTPRTRVGGGKAKLIGTYDYFNEQAIFHLQGYGDSGAPNGYTLAFSPKKGGFTSYFTYYPEWIGNAQEKVLVWNGGQPYVLDSATRNTFFGTAYDSVIKVVFKGSEAQEKTWESVKQLSGTPWDCPEIISALESFGITKQKSRLVIKDFRKLGQKYSATFRRDINSRGGLVNGNYLKGNYLVVTFRALQPTGVTSLSLVTVYSIDSPLNK
jgi:hypothetical protein